MYARELIVLGTASQGPTRYRNHNGYLLRWDDQGILFDPGEGTQRQMIYAGVTTAAISRICITHFHGDHCLGLAGIGQRISLDRVSHTVPVHYPASGQVYYDRLRASSIFVDVASIQACPIAGGGVVAASEKWTLTALPLDHGVDTFGYRLQERDHRTLLPERLAERGIVGPQIGELVRAGELTVGGRTTHVAEVSVPRPGQSVAFVMDTRMCPNALTLAHGVDLLICESTYLHIDADKALAHGHLTAVQAATLAAEAGVRQLVLTHFSQRYPEVGPFLDEACPIFPGTVAAADGDVIRVPERGP